MDLQTFWDNFDAIAEAPGGVQRLRELILDLAVRGKLVPQDPADEPAEKLLERLSNEKVALIKSRQIPQQRKLDPFDTAIVPYELPDNWHWCRWNDAVIYIGDVDHKMPTEVPNGFPYVSPRDFQPGNVIDFNNAKKISAEDFEKLRRKVQPRRGDLIFPRYGTIGENRLVTTDIDFLASYSCAVIKNFHGYIEPKYSYYYSLSRLVKSEIEKYKNKTTQANVGIKSIQSFVFPLPPLAEQKRIVAKVDQLMTLCDTLETHLRDTQAKAEALAAAVVGQLEVLP